MTISSRARRAKPLGKVKSVYPPWDALAEGYYRSFSASQGRPAKDARLVIGAVIIKHKLCLSDEETVQQIQENPYLQYFVGLPGYQTQVPAARTATGAETAALAAESDQAFLVAGFTAYPQKSVFEPAASQIVFEFPLNIAGQRPAFLCQLLPESRVVLRDQLME
jgi:hypothetical protein